MTRHILRISAHVGSFLARHGAYVGAAFTAFVLLLFGLMLLFGDRPRWNAEWRAPYAVEVCPGLISADPDALEHITAGYAHVEAAGHPGPTSIAVGSCEGPVEGVRWAVGVPEGGRAGDTYQTHHVGVMVHALVVLDRSQLSPGLYRHEAWHTIGAEHPWIPSTDHVLHPGGPGHVWGTATRGYER